MGIFLLLAFIPGYAYDIISVNTVDRPANMKLNRKLFTERKLICVISGIMMKDRTKDAAKTMSDMKNMKATYALNVMGIPARRRFVCSSSNSGKKRSIFLPNQL